MFGYGPAASGAPNGLLGAGVALGTIRGVRLELDAQLGWSSGTTSVDASPAWNDAFQTYSGGEWTARTAVFELQASRRTGPVEVWAGAGAHVSWVQFEATYEATRCSDFFCTSSYRVTDQEGAESPGRVGLVLSTGARYAVFRKVLVGLDLRWLSPVTSRVREPFGVGARLGGLSATAGLTLRLGGAVPR